MQSIGKTQRSLSGELAVHCQPPPASAVPQSAESAALAPSARWPGLAPSADSPQPGTPSRPAKRSRIQPGGAGHLPALESVTTSVSTPAHVNDFSTVWNSVPNDIWTKIMRILEPSGYVGPLVEASQATYAAWSAVDSPSQQSQLRDASSCLSRDYDHFRKGKPFFRDGVQFMNFFQCAWTQERLPYVKVLDLGGRTVQSDDMPKILSTVADRAKNLQLLCLQSMPKISPNSLVAIGLLECLPKLRSLVIFYFSETQFNDNFLQQVGKLTHLERFSAFDRGSHRDQNTTKPAAWTPHGLQYLTHLRHLSWLEMDRPSRLPGALSVLAKITSLEKLSIRGWTGFTESVLRATLKPLLKLSTCSCRTERDGKSVLTYFDPQENRISGICSTQREIWTSFSSDLTK